MNNGRDAVFNPALFYITGNFVPCYIKTLRGDRTAAERKMPLLRPAAGEESCKAGFCFIGNSSEPVKERYFAQKQSACRDRGCGGKDPLSAGTENRRNRDAAEKKKKTEYERGDNHG